MTGPPPVRVMLVDDQELVRTGLRMVLEEHPRVVVVGEAGDGDEALRLARAVAPQVVLMDVRMPGTDGVEATRRLTAEVPEARVLILTTFDLDEYAFAALRYGASGFLLKDVPSVELIRSILAVAEGDAVIAPSVTRRLLDIVTDRLPDPRRPPSDADMHHLASLTDREREVMAEIATGLTNREIAEKLYMAEATVKTHVSRIFNKLDLRDRVHAVVFAYEVGLVSPSRPPFGRNLPEV